MDERFMNCLIRIEGHLDTIAKAASLKITRATSSQKTETKKREISDEDRPTEAHKELAKQLGVNIGLEWPRFKNYCKAHAVRYASFDAAFRKWLLSNQPRPDKSRLL